MLRETASLAKRPHHSAQGSPAFGVPVHPGTERPCC
jgi:hypothetical protein